MDPNIPFKGPLNYDTLFHTLAKSPALNKEDKNLGLGGGWYENVQTGQMESRFRFNEEQARVVQDKLNSITASRNIDDPSVIFVAKDNKGQFLVVVDSQKFDEILKKHNLITGVTDEEVSKVGDTLRNLGSSYPDRLRQKFKFIHPESLYRVERKYDRKGDDHFIINVLTRNLPWNPSPQILAGTDYELSAEEFRELIRELGLKKEPQQEPQGRVATKPKAEKPQVEATTPKLTARATDKEVEKKSSAEQTEPIATASVANKEVQKALNKLCNGTWSGDKLELGKKLQKEFSHIDPYFISPATQYSIERDGNNFTIYGRSTYKPFAPGDLGIPYKVSAENFRKLISGLGLDKKPTVEQTKVTTGATDKEVEKKSSVEQTQSETTVSVSAEVVDAIKPTSGKGLDIDGLPSFDAIKHMTPDAVELTYNQIIKDNEIILVNKQGDQVVNKQGDPVKQLKSADHLNFLAKVAVAGEEKGGLEGRGLLFTAVELYAKSLKIDPKKIEDAEQRSEQTKSVVSDLMQRSTSKGYLTGGEGSKMKLRDLSSSVKAAFEGMINVLRLPSLQAIKGMKPADVELTYNQMIKDNRGADPLNFLAIVAVAGQEKGDNLEGRGLITKAVELYAKNLKIDITKITNAEQQSEVAKRVVSDLIFRSMAYSPGGEGSNEKLSELSSSVKAAFEMLIDNNTIMEGGRRKFKDKIS